MRLMLIALRARAALSSQRVDGPISVQVLEGRIRFSAESHIVIFPDGQMVSLQAGLPSVEEASEESVLQ